MADIIIQVTLAADKESITIDNQSTDDLSSITGLTADIFGADKVTGLYSIDFTSGEVTEFKAKTPVVLEFVDSRFVGSTYAPDNYYTVVITADTSDESNPDTFAIILALAEKVHINNATVNLRPQELFQIQANVQATIALETLDRLSNSTTVDREVKWRDIYYFISTNIVNTY